MSLQIEELSNIPVYNMDLEEPDEPPSVQALKAAVGEADALLLAIPEHNYSFSGVMKNAIDWLSRPFDTSVLLDKPVAIMGASSGRMGTARAQHAIRPVLAATGCFVMIKLECTYHRPPRCDANGDVIDESTQKRVRTMVEALLPDGSSRGAPSTGRATAEGATVEPRFKTTGAQPVSDAKGRERPCRERTSVMMATRVATNLTVTSP